jgi:hypothetical protein
VIASRAAWNIFWWATSRVIIPQRAKLAETSDCWSGPPLSGAAGTPCPRDG